MIGNHQRHLHRQLTALHTPEQIHQTMTLLARENRNLRPGIRKMQLCLTGESLRECLCSCRQSLTRNPESLQLPFDPAEKHAGAGIGVMVGMADVATIGCHPAGKLTHQSRTIRTDQLQDHGRCRHGNALKS